MCPSNLAAEKPQTLTSTYQAQPGGVGLLAASEAEALQLKLWVGQSPGPTEPPTKCAALKALWGLGEACLAQRMARFAKPGLCDRNKSQTSAQILPLRVY